MNFLEKPDFELAKIEYAEFTKLLQSVFESMGCNVLALAPGQCIMVDGNPITKQRLETAGCDVMTYPGKEISTKGGGGPTCLTRPLFRSI